MFSVQNDTDNDFDNVRMLGNLQFTPDYGYPSLKMWSDENEGFKWVSEKSLALLMIDIMKHPFTVGSLVITGFDCNEFKENHILIESFDFGGNKAEWLINSSDKKYYRFSTINYMNEGIVEKEYESGGFKDVDNDGQQYDFPFMGFRIKAISTQEEFDIDCNTSITIKKIPAKKTLHFFLYELIK